jgi:hypothetical protein
VTDKKYTIIRETAVLPCPVETCTVAKQDARRIKEHVENMHGWAYVSIAASTSILSATLSESHLTKSGATKGIGHHLGTVHTPTLSHTSVRVHPYEKIQKPASDRGLAAIANNNLAMVTEHQDSCSALLQPRSVEAPMDICQIETTKDGPNFDNSEMQGISVEEGGMDFSMADSTGDGPNCNLSELQGSLHNLHALPGQHLPEATVDNSSSYLFSTPFLAQHSLRIHTHFKTIHCMICLSAHPPSCMSKHLELHGINMDQAAKYQLAIIALEQNLVIDRLVVNPLPGGPPIEGLKVVQAGWSCGACIYCTISDKTFKNHWYSQHSGHTKGASKRIAVQNFFPSVYNYFSVNTQLISLSTADPFFIYITHEVPQLMKPPVLAAAMQPREVPPLLQITGWHHHLEDYMIDKPTLRALRSLMELPRLNETSPLGRLRNIVWLYMHTIRTHARSAPLAVRCILKEWPRYFFMQEGLIIQSCLFYP